MSIQTLGARLQWLGGDNMGRINQSKYMSFQAALKNDYNKRMIKFNNQSWPCLINSMSGGLKADYDKKYISVDFNSGLKAGETFELLDSGTHWMVYLPVITETAYLRSEIIRCDYTLNVNGQEYWIFLGGL